MSTRRTPSYWQVAAFFLPLSLTNIMISLSHSVVNAGVARTPDPEVSLSAYALARSFVQLMDSPIGMVRQTVTSLVQNRVSFNTMSRFAYTTAFIIMVAVLFLALTPVGFALFHTILGVAEPIARQSHMALAVLFLLPFTSVTRNLYHGVAMIARQTYMVPISTAIRFVVMSSVIFLLAYNTEIPGAVSASAAFISAFSVEAVIMRWRARPLLRVSQHLAIEEPQALTYGSIGIFLLPLMFTTFMQASFLPVINIGLARTISPEIALAAFAVGHNLGTILTAPLRMLHQVAIAFARPSCPESFTVIKRFICHLTVLMTCAMAILGFSPLGHWVLTRLIGVSDTVAQSAVLVLQAQTALAVLIGWREYLWGILMQQRLTGIIGRGKTINLVVLVVSALGLMSLGRFNPAACGAWAFVTGEFSECIYMRATYHRSASYQKRLDAHYAPDEASQKDTPL